jgi:hypothetical protein
MLEIFLNISSDMKIWFSLYIGQGNDTFDATVGKLLKLIPCFCENWPAAFAYLSSAGERAKKWH